jgi:hypothetical protein
MNTAAVMRATFDATFPELKSLPAGADRVPGRPLGELVMKGLRERGFSASDVQYEEPFFVTRCRSGEHTYHILSYLAYSDDTGSAWVVTCQRSVGFWGKLFGRSDDTDLAPVLEAIDDIIKRDNRLTDIRWFEETPLDPFSQQKHATSPQTRS